MDDRAADGATAEETADQLYFQALETLLGRLRGAGLLLAPADWQVAAEWRRRGVPLELVARTMEDLYARRKQRDAKRKINSLRYFAPAVEAAWEELRALTGTGHRLPAPPFDAAGRLERLAEALPDSVPERERWADRIRALTGDSATVEARLAELDHELLTACEASLPPEGRARVEAGRDTLVSQLVARLPAEEVEVAVERLGRQQLRRHLGLPVLSLFSPEARPPDEADDTPRLEPDVDR